MKSFSKNDVIVIAGAGKGIGFAVTQYLLSNFPEINILAISRDVSKLSVLKNQHSSLLVLSADLGNFTESNTNLIINTLKGKNLIGVIFTAGILEKKNIGSISKDLFSKIYSGNVWSFINLIQLLYPNITEQTHIVSIGSIGGISGTQKFPGMSTYSSSKAALSIYTECLAEELKEKGATANCLSIGAVNTEMMKEAFPDYTSEINPEDIAPYIVSFTLFDKKLFNGKTIPVSSSTP